MSCETLKNTGVPPCAFLLKNIKRPMFVPKYDASLALNEYASYDLVDKATLQAKFDAEDIDNRYFVLPEVDQDLNERAETEFFTYDSGQKARLRRGTRSFSAVFPLAYAYLIEAIESFEGSDIGIWAGDSDSNFVYYKDKETLTKIRPIPIDSKSLSASYVWHKNDTPAGVKIEFDFKSSMKDQLLDFIPESDLDFDPLDSADWYAQRPVTTKKSTVTSPTNTTFTATLVDDYGKKIKGLVVGDFTSRLAASPYTGQTISSITEGEDGVYAGVYDASHTTEESRLLISKSGYNFNESNATANTGGFTFTVAT